MAAREIIRKRTVSDEAMRLREALGSAKPISDKDPLKKRSEEIDRRLRTSRAKKSGLVEAIY